MNVTVHPYSHATLLHAGCVEKLILVRFCFCFVLGASSIVDSKVSTGVNVSVNVCVSVFAL